MDEATTVPAVRELPVWHVTVVLAGEPVDVRSLVRGLETLLDHQPFLGSARYSRERVELRYWDEAEDVDDAAAMALRIWPEHRDLAGLPDWHVVGLEVLDRDTLRERRERGLVPETLVLGEIRPL